MSTKGAKTIYVDTVLFDRCKDACAALGGSVSSFIEDYLRANVGMLEAASSSDNPDEQRAAVKSSFSDVMLNQFIELGEALRRFQEDESGKDGSG